MDKLVYGMIHMRRRIVRVEAFFKIYGDVVM